ncbi:hypothetical protein J7E32_00760 [Bacillus sp. ISL-55]|nr:hypothetical protein [Bacillus sp. ISL-55]
MNEERIIKLILPAAVLGIMAEYLPLHEGLSVVKGNHGYCGQSGNIFEKSKLTKKKGYQTRTQNNISNVYVKEGC